MDRLSWLSEPTVTPSETASKTDNISLVAMLTCRHARLGAAMLFSSFRGGTSCSIRGNCEPTKQTAKFLDLFRRSHPLLRSQPSARV